VFEKASVPSERERRPFVLGLMTLEDVPKKLRGKERVRVP